MCTSKETPQAPPLEIRFLCVALAVPTLNSEVSLQRLGLKVSTTTPMLKSNFYCNRLENVLSLLEF